MALYRYVSGRDDLLDGVIERVIDDLYKDPDVHVNADLWQDYLVRLAHGVRRIALNHPQVFPLIATRPPAAPWVKPPLRSLRWMESFLSTLTRSRFSTAAAITAYRAFSSFLLGHLLLEVASQEADAARINGTDSARVAPADLTQYPLLRLIEPELSGDDAETEFGAALATLVHRLEQLM